MFGSLKYLYDNIVELEQSVSLIDFWKIATIYINENSRLKHRNDLQIWRRIADVIHSACPF